MTGPLIIRIFERLQPVFTGEFDGPVELGRQTERDETPFARNDMSGRVRVVIARLSEDGVSRRHALIEPIGLGRVRVTNLSAKLPVELQDDELSPQTTRDLPLPVVLNFGRKTTVRVESPDPTTMSLEGLAEMATPPGLEVDASRLATLPAPVAGMDTEALVRWLQAMTGVLQSAASSSDFFTKAAQALVEQVGLDSGRVLLLKGEEWVAVTVRTSPRLLAEPTWRPSRQVLARVLEEKRTFWQVPNQAGVLSSLTGVRAVVAAPVLDRQGKVIGALYGDRRQDNRSGFAPPITRLQALLVELLAGSVAAGLARLEQEQAALAARVRFEQFFTPELSRQLAAQPDLLKGHDAEVTILFADIRSFSRASERLGPGGTLEWINDVMEALSECVLDERGVLVDYIGDELMAMWGAPEEQPDHAQRACRAALAMLQRLPELDERWRAQLDEPLALGIGVNTGQARVGNTGSRRKFKYGPLGNTVNVASRVEGATKYLQTRVLVTGQTRAQLDDAFAVRRLGKVAVVNIAEPVELYELVPAGQPDWASLREDYEKALEEFGRQDFRATARILGNLLTEHPGDGPSLVLLSRAVHYLIEGPAGFDPAWKLPGK